MEPVQEAVSETTLHVGPMALGFAGLRRLSGAARAAAAHRSTAWEASAASAARAASRRRAERY